MIIVWGSNMYGRVDDVPGMFYISTKFGHLWYLPLIPCGSYMVFKEQGKVIAAVPVGFSFKSLIMAWLRTAMVFLTVGCFCFVLLELLDKRMSVSNVVTASVVFAIVAAVCGYVCYGKPFRRASYRRALQWAEKAKFNDEGNIMLEAHFGNITMEEASSLIETARQIAAEQGAPALGPLKT